MPGRDILVYYAWSRPGETGAPLEVIENRFPTLFESRRIGYPRFEELADPALYDQSVAGFLDHILKQNFIRFTALAGDLAGRPVREVERVTDDGAVTPLDEALIAGADTVIVISFDEFRTRQTASAAEIAAVTGFLARPDSLLFVCPHHDIGSTEGVAEAERPARQLGDFLHHGDRSIPPQQRFGGFARALLDGLGVPVANRFGLHPAALPDGSPAPIEVETDRDRLGLLSGVTTFNLHPHLPHLERLGPAEQGMEVLARQAINLAVPPHPFSRIRTTFDALLQSRADVFAGTLLVGDATLWSSTAGGVDSLSRLWANVVRRPARA